MLTESLVTRKAARWRTRKCRPAKDFQRSRGRGNNGRRGVRMARTVGIGKQDFEKLILEDVFYVDKTKFIKE